MTAVKKKLLIALAFVAMLFAGIALLSACSGNEDDLKVTFMVQEDGGAGIIRRTERAIRLKTAASRRVLPYMRALFQSKSRSSSTAPTKECRISSTS